MKYRKKHVVIEAEQFWPDSEPLPFKDRGLCCLDADGWYVLTAHDHRSLLATGLPRSPSLGAHIPSSPTSSRQPTTP